MPDFFPLDDPEAPAPVAEFSDLVTCDEVKTAENVTTAAYDASIEQIIPQVSAAVRSFTDRDFGAAATVETRAFEYRGGGVLDIDDCSAIVAVKMDGRGLAQNRDYRPQRERRGGPYFYLDMYVEPGRFASPEMGFTRNEDTYTAPRYRPQSALVTVEGEFGWTTVPEDVKLAAIEMIRAVLQLPTDDLQNESIAEYSYSQVAQPFNSGRWPTRAVDLLRPYRRINL